MAALTFDDLKFAQTLKAYPVAVPEFGDGKEAWISELTANERDDRLEIGWNEYKTKRGGASNEGATAWIVAACLCTGPDRTFMCNDAASLARFAEELGNCGKVVARLYRKVEEVNSIGPAEIAKLEKN